MLLAKDAIKSLAYHGKTTRYDAIEPAVYRWSMERSDVQLTDGAGQADVGVHHLVDEQVSRRTQRSPTVATVVVKEHSAKNSIH